MNYPAYTNNGQYYMQSLEDMRNRIDNQIRQYQQNQMQQPQIPQINQNFQLAPNPINSELEAKYVDTIDEVKNTFVMKTGVFVNKDYSTLWVKDVSGKIRTFNTVEVVEMDEKDKEIYNLKKQIEEMKGMIANEPPSINSNFDESNGSEATKRISTSKKSNAK